MVMVMCASLSFALRMHAVSWLRNSGSGPWLHAGMYPSAMAHRVRPIIARGGCKSRAEAEAENHAPPRRRVAAHLLVSGVAQVLDFDERREVLAVVLHVRVDSRVAGIGDARERRDGQEILARAAAHDHDVRVHRAGAIAEEDRAGVL